MTSQLLPIAFVKHAKDNVIQSGEVSWDTLAEEFGGPVPLTSATAEKLYRDAFSLVKYRPNTRRAAANVESIAAIVIDLDHVNSATFIEVLKQIAPFRYIIYSSYSHSERHKIDHSYNCRVIFPLDEPIAAVDWAGAWSYFVSTLPTMHDPKGSGKSVPCCDISCSDPSRIFFVPGSPDISCAFSEVNAGKPLCAADLVREGRKLPMQSTVVSVEADGLSRVDLLASIKKLAKSKSDEVQQAAKWLRLMADGEAWCSTPGQRHAVMLKMTLQLESAHPLVSCTALSRLFGPSLATMRAQQPHERAITLDEIEKALEGARKRRKTAEAETAKIRDELETGGLGKYNDAEIDAICADQGITREQLRTRWIVQSQNGYYVLTPNGYTNTASAVEMPSVLRSLQRAPVHVFNIKKDGLKLRPLGDIMHDCGEILAGGIIADMTIARNTIAEDGVMHESICQLRKHKDIFPERQIDFEGLVAALREENEPIVVDRFLDWLATVTRTDRVTCALHLMGQTGGGKTIIANGLAHLWKKVGAVPLEEALKPFNETVLTCPVLLADEEKPKALTAAHFRSLLGTESFSVSRKFKSNVVLKGAFRVICTANDPDFFKFKNENLTADALAATAPRILTVYFGPKAIAYMAGQKDWLVREVVAKHALWLRDNHEVVLGNRWCVEGIAGASHRRLALGDDTRGRMYEVISNFARDPKPMEQQCLSGILVEEGKFWLHAPSVAKMWKVYTDQIAKDDQPSGKQVSDTLRDMRVGKMVNKRVPRGGVGKKSEVLGYSVIDPEIVFDFIEANGDDSTAAREMIERSKKDEK